MQFNIELIFKIAAIGLLITVVIQVLKKSDRDDIAMLVGIVGMVIVLSLVIIGILLQIVNLIYLGGIPLFSGYLKARAATRIWLLSYLIFLPSINILIAKYDNKKYYLLFLLGLLLFVATGYRTTAMAIVISVLITLYYTKDLPWKYLILS